MISEGTSKTKYAPGPGMVVAAAFIGPGTVTMCIMAGYQAGFLLLWVMLLSTLVTMLLQEMSARVGVVTQLGLVENVKLHFAKSYRMVALLLILLAVVLGNAAYEAGNISGAVMGLQWWRPDWTPAGPLVIGALAFGLLWRGSQQLIGQIFTALVAVMSLSFLVSAVLTKPDIPALLSGLLFPRVAGQDWLLILGLMGTTIVPYNLFLHAALARDRWKSASDLKAARKDTIIGVGIGGAISMGIIVCGAAIPSGQSALTAPDLAQALTPLYGAGARVLLSVGLFAAGITSAITAPLAAALVASACFGWSQQLTDWRFRSVWIFILSFGVAMASAGYKPVPLIQTAQVANAVVLPVSVVVLLILGGGAWMGRFRNPLWINVAGIFVVLMVMILSVKSMWALL